MLSKMETSSREHEALRISESRYRRLFETARDGILLLNSDTAQIEDVNPYLIEMLGYTHAEFLGKKLWEVGAFADVAQSKEMFIVLQHTGYVRYENLPLKTRSGKQIAVEFVSNAYDCEGVKVIQCNVRDVTAHNEADRVLREFKALVNASDDAIVSESLDGIIKSWNPGAEKLFGYTSEEAVGHSIAMLIPPGRPNDETEILERLARGERVEHFENVRCHKDGHFIDISATISPIVDDRGHVTGASKIIRNITERKQAEAERTSLEAQLRESQKMEAIGTLAGGIAHDFNNIIATILGNVDLALEDTVGNPPAQQSIEEIRRAGRRARDLVQQILSFSRRQPLERKRIALTPVVKESVRLMHATFPARITINLSCAIDTPEVLADATQIEQALLNLGTNAMQAADGENLLLDIRLDTVIMDASFANGLAALRSIHLSRPERTVRLTISDNGPGMDVATCARIFEPFFTTKPVGEGTGLGLSVVRGIMQAHEGAIVVASQPGVGTTFTLYFPPAKPADSASFATAKNAHANEIRTTGDHRRLLYIDDDKAMVSMVKRVLERRGYVVSAFVDAREALDKLRSDPSAFEFVVSDYNMPYLSGLDVAREIRKIRADLPVAIISGFIDETLLSQAKDAGVRELIVKTINVGGLSEAIERLATSVAVTPLVS